MILEVLSSHDKGVEHCQDTRGTQALPRILPTTAGPVLQALHEELTTPWTCRADPCMGFSPHPELPRVLPNLLDGSFGSRELLQRGSDGWRGTRRVQEEREAVSSKRQPKLH